MSDPYRPQAEPGSRRVIARRSSSALALNLALALLGLATPLAAKQWGEDVPALFVLMLLAVPMGLLHLGRSLHAWVLPHSIEIDANGLRFAWADKITALPWLRRRDCEVSWSDFQALHTDTVSVNGVADTGLVVTTIDGSISIPDDWFDRSAHLIQRDILDFLDLQRERPAGASSEFARRCRERFATPERMVAKPWGVIGAAAFFLPFIGFPVWFAIITPAWITAAFAAAAVCLFGGLTLLGFREWLADRVLVLRGDGLGIGRSDARLRSIPWEDIRLVRRDVVNGKTESIDIVSRDGSRTSLRLNYFAPGGGGGRKLDDIARMIDPAAY